MKYLARDIDLSISKNKKIQEFVKKYPNSKQFRFELTEHWQPEDFDIKRYQIVEIHC